jgi:glycosyltransferase involved in cell wall biosynthesis
MASVSGLAGLVSVVIPVRNRAELLRETLASLAAQTYAQWEAVVVDDRSDEKYLPDLRAACGVDSRVRLLTREGDQGGAPVCRNQGWAASRGEFVMFLDSDDLLAPGCFAGRVDKLTADAGLDFVVANCRLFRATPGDTPLLFNGPSDVPDLERLLMLDFPWQTSGPLWRRAFVDRVGPWDAQLPSWQDWDFHVRALAQKPRHAWMPEPDFFYRLPEQKPGATNLGNKALTPEHVVTRRPVLAKLTTQLRVAGLLTPSAARRLAALYMYLCETLLRTDPKRYRADAVALWKDARRQRLVTWPQYVTGSVLFKHYQVGFLRGGLHRRMKKRWPADLFFRHSPTFCRTPDPSASPAPADTHAPTP